MNTAESIWDSFELRWSAYSFLAAVAIVFATLTLPHWSASSHPAAPRAMSSVIVSDPVGHGSGVHIGNGFILTAAHVVEDRSDMEVTDDQGRSQAALVMWSNKAYDVALLRIDDASGLETSPLRCNVRLNIGDQVSAIGNPVNLKFIHVWGRVASVPSERRPWKSSILADMTIAPGMSGGGVFDKAGNLIGLAVGIAATGPVVYAISYIVPIDAACILMGRS